MLVLTEGVFFLFTPTATCVIYTLSLHDALPICGMATTPRTSPALDCCRNLRDRYDRTSAGCQPGVWRPRNRTRSEEHTSELQSRLHLVCRLLLEKKKNNACQTRRRSPICDPPGC